MDETRRHDAQDPGQPRDDVPGFDAPPYEEPRSTDWDTWETAGSEGPGSSTGREWMNQLQSMIDQVATQAAPVVREIGAKAAELAAVAGEKAGPFAHRAADVTAVAGTKMAERGRVLAAELRREAEARRAGADHTEATTPEPPLAAEPPPAVAAEPPLAVPDEPPPTVADEPPLADESSFGEPPR
jgi:hypothetical protein